MLQHYKDFEMSVPYGMVRGKIWKSPDHELGESTVRVLALHGWQDNCGSFDNLIPKLPTNYYVVAIDFPGHGLSSHLPAGCPYNDIVFVIEVHRVIKSLGWTDKPMSILGHSMGAAIGIFYTCLFPTYVERVITLDIIKPLTFPAAKLAEKTREGIDSFLQLEGKNCPHPSESPKPVDKSSFIPTYDHDTAVQKLISAHSIFGLITKDAAEVLLKRGSKPSPQDPEKVFFTRDNRLKAMLFQRMDNDSLIHYLERLQCQLLVIKAENGVKLDPPDVSKRFIELYEKQCSRFEMVTVPGGHHVHLVDADTVSKPIVDFIEKEPIGQNGTTTNGTTNGIK